MRIMCDEPTSEVGRDIRKAVGEVREEVVKGQASTRRP